MGLKIKLQHLGETIDLEVDVYDSLLSLKDKIEKIFNIQSSQQSLFFDGRNISTSVKPLIELGIKENSLISIKKIHQIRGQSKSGDISSLMKNPMIKNMFKNPETINSMKKMFPELQENLKDNKTLSMIINSGGLEEELERMASDGDYMSTQLRNADLTMSKLENIPGGINMMSSMLRDAEEPFRWFKSEPEINSGNQITTKMTESIPGTSKRNSFIEYRRQLGELRQIGFENTRENIEVLKTVNGDLEAALAVLITKKEAETI